MTPVLANFLSGIGMGELVIILLIVLIIFGANKLPQLGDSLGKGIKNFKSAVSGKDEQKAEAPASSPAQAPKTEGPAPTEKKDA
jgi:sec-independent protein translocase protein TatA